MENNMLITLEQQKIISNPIRSQIIMLLFDEAMTSKQVATKLDKTPGNIHYHIQKLYEHGILELEREEKNKGIIEKYYRSKAINFTTEENSQQETNIHSRYTSTLTLSNDELEQFEEKLKALIVEFARLSLTSNEERSSYTFNATIAKLIKEAEE